MGSALVIQHPFFDVDPWLLRESRFDLDVLAQSESLFTLSNGHIGWRGNLDEGEPHGLLGSYLNGVYDLRPLPYAEAGYGYPEQDQVVVNVTDGKVLRLLVDDEPFDIRYGTLHLHERVLDFRSGLLERRAEWSTPTDKRVRVTSTRLVSLVERSIAAIKYQVEAVDAVRIVVQSELVANEPPPPPPVFDPRTSVTLEAPWRSLDFDHRDTRALLLHETSYSDITMSAAMDHEVSGPSSTEVMSESFADVCRVTVTVALEPGERLTIIKYVAYGWSAVRSKEALRDQTSAALVAARASGWDGLCKEQRDYLDDFWRRADVEIDGDEEIQQAVRFSLFHVLQAGARNEGRAIPAKGLTGTGYDGHCFWDSEMYVMPVLNYTAPEAVKHALTWRHSTLDLARERAAQLGFRGAAFPWRTIAGAECSAYWPAGTAAFHVSTDVADAVVRYLHATADESFEREFGCEILLETARLWASLGHFDLKGAFRIDGVTGPDEYSAIADNNVYTNVMVIRNLRAAADTAERQSEVAQRLGVDEKEIASWRAAAEAMFIPFDEMLGVHQQSEGFTFHQLWDFEGTEDDEYPLLLHFPYFDLYRKQVIKQADLVLAMVLCGEDFTDEQKLANFDYYERLTVRDSSLSACVQSVMAAEVGYLDLAYDYLAEAALMDLDDLEHNTRDGLHMASLAGSWIALVAGLAGMRNWSDSLSFSPELPDGITRLAFNIVFCSRRLRVETRPDSTTYELVEGDALTVRHRGESIELRVGAPVVATSTRAPHPAREAPGQPFGRAPLRRLADSQRVADDAE
ncbi:MAG: glycosyl hydrolase family 65 protein [Acidimicrobiales bacterium]